MAALMSLSPAARGVCRPRRRHYAWPQSLPSESAELPRAYSTTQRHERIHGTNVARSCCISCALLATTPRSTRSSRWGRRVRRTAGWMGFRYRGRPPCGRQAMERSLNSLSSAYLMTTQTPSLNRGLLGTTTPPFAMIMAWIRGGRRRRLVEAAVRVSWRAALRFAALCSKAGEPYQTGSKPSHGRPQAERRRGRDELPRRASESKKP